MNTSSSPGKIILTGEHAILAGCPALAMASTPRVTCRVEAWELPRVNLHLPGRTPESRTQLELAALSGELQQRHAEGHPPACPEDLLFVAVHRMLPEWTGEITFETDLPIGSGMGASAAFLGSLIHALQPDMSVEELFNTCLELEHLQHGISSGLDLWTSLHGGLWWVEGTRCTALNLEALPDFEIYHTGAPASTTGECVNRVHKAFPEGHAIWKDFQSTIEATKEALIQNQPHAWSDAIHQNHALLCEVGVVPDAVRNAIQTLEQRGGAAKICGAGSIRGDAAGIVLVRDAAKDDLPSSWRKIGAAYSPTGVCSP